MTDQTFYTEGAGNSFFLSFSGKHSFKQLLTEAVSQNVNPDGYILCKEAGDAHLSFRFYNKDGTEVDFCGNALRAVALCYKSITGQSLCHIETKSGLLRAEVKGEGLVSTEMPPSILKRKVKVNGLVADFILSGVPHLVFDAKKCGLVVLGDQKMKDFCLVLRGMNLDEMETYNLTFYIKNPLDSDVVDCITFERGVEDFTLACGSGALSVATALNETSLRLKMPGGELKVVSVDGVNYMLGPAKIIKVY